MLVFLLCNRPNWEHFSFITFLDNHSDDAKIEELEMETASVCLAIAIIESSEQWKRSGTPSELISVPKTIQSILQQVFSWYLLHWA